MNRRKHNRSRKVHYPELIEYRGKSDSADVHCSCGFIDIVAVWYGEVSGWTNLYGKPLVDDAVPLMVQSYLTNLTRTKE
jgi:hypothetical protein